MEKQKRRSPIMEKAEGKNAVPSTNPFALKVPEDTKMSKQEEPSK